MYKGSSELLSSNLFIASKLVVVPNLIISVIILVLFAVLSGGITNPATRHGKYSTPDLKYWQLFIYASVMSLLALPGVVITNR